MICATADNSYLLFLKKQPTRAEFLRVAGVLSGTYAEELMLGLYDDIFVYSGELRRQYLRYYTIEYARFSQFADALTGIPETLLPKIDEHFRKFEFIIHYRGAQEYLRGDEGLETLGRLLRQKISR